MSMERETEPDVKPKVESSTKKSKSPRKSPKTEMKSTKNVSANDVDAKYLILETLLDIGKVAPTADLICEKTFVTTRAEGWERGC
jgi:hypothetical protein